MATNTAARSNVVLGGGVRPAYAQPGDAVSAFYGEHFGGVQDNDIGLSAQPGNHGSRCAQSGPLVDEGHAAGHRCKKQGLFGGGVAAADDGDLAAGELVTVAFGAGADSIAAQLTLPGGRRDRLTAPIARISAERDASPVDLRPT